MADVKIANATYSDVEQVELQTPDGESVLFSLGGSGGGGSVSVTLDDDGNIKVSGGGSGGSSEQWKLIKHIIVESEVTSIRVNEDEDGNPFSLKKTLIFGSRVMPASGTHNYCYFRGTDGTSTPAYGNGIVLGDVGQGAGNSAGTVRYFVCSAENLTSMIDVSIWSHVTSLSLNETSSNGAIAPSGVSGIDSVGMTGNNLTANFTNASHRIKYISDIALGTYSGNVWGVGSEIYIMGVES